MTSEQPLIQSTYLPLVSIVITIKNEEEYIGGLLESIMKMDYPKDRFETIVVDGGSSDKTVDIVSRYSWVKLIVSNCSHAEGINIGFSEAKGSIIACTDGDCLVDRGWLSCIVQYFQKDKKIVAIGGPYLPSDQKEFLARCYAVLAQSWFPKKTGFTDNPNKMGMGNIAFRRSLIDEIGPINESIGMGTQIKSGDDIDYNQRIINSGHHLFYAKDMKIYHRFRTTMKGNFGEVFQRGNDASKFYRYKSSIFNKWKRRNTFLIITLNLLTVLFLLGISFIGPSTIYITLGLILGYYIIKIARFTYTCRYNVGILAKLVAPLIDIGLFVVWYLGAIRGLLSRKDQILIYDFPPRQVINRVGIDDSHAYKDIYSSELPKISIVVTVKNEEKYIGSLLDSIYSLAYPQERFETIIVDGGSTDMTLKIISHASKYASIKLIKTACNISEGRNIGIKESSGEIVAFTDGDCIVDKNWLKNIVKNFEEYGRIVAVGGPYLPLDQKGIFNEYMRFWTKSWFPEKTGFTNSPQKVGTGNLAFKKGILEEVGGFDEHLLIGEDIDINQRILDLGFKILYAKDVLVYHYFRTSFAESSKSAIGRGVGASKYYIEKHAPGLPMHLLKILSFIAIVLANIMGLVSGVSIINYFTIFSVLCLYFSKVIRLYRKGLLTGISLVDKVTIPLIDIYMMLLWFLGSIKGLAKTHSR